MVGTIPGIMVRGTDTAVCIALGITAGMILGTTTGTIPTGAHGAGHTMEVTTATTLGIHHIIMVIMDITMVVAVEAITTDVQATLVPSTSAVAPIIVHLIAILSLPAALVWAA